MRDPNQDSDAAQSGRQQEGDHDDLEPDRDAVPQAIEVETSAPLGCVVQAQNLRTDRGDPERADTDRDESGDAGAGVRAVECPRQLSFRLRAVKARNMRCFFCQDFDCDVVFMARGEPAWRNKAYAAHARCVVAHTELEQESR